MSGHSLERKVNADPAKVWALVTDVDSFTDMIRGITDVERLDDLPQFGVGTRWRETRKMFGSEATDDDVANVMVRKRVEDRVHVNILGWHQQPRILFRRASVARDRCCSEISACRAGGKDRMNASRAASW